MVARETEKPAEESFADESAKDEPAEEEAAAESAEEETADEEDAVENAAEAKVDEVPDEKVTEESTDEEAVVEDTEPETPALDYEIEKIDDTIMYAKQDCNVRKGPSTDYDKVGSLSLNEEVTVNGKVTADNGKVWYVLKSEDEGHKMVAGSLL